LDLKAPTDPHLPVMVGEVIEWLAVRPGGRYVDATLGDGGHAQEILENSAPDGQLLAIDWDDEALQRSRARLQSFGERVEVKRVSFAALGSAIDSVGWSNGADGVFIDLGVSTVQLRSPGRGFSFTADGPLDMRMDRRRETTAADLVNGLAERELADVIYGYGEERASRRIARQIVERRKRAPITTTGELREAVVAAGVRGRPGHDPATRTFQALRIAVNTELDEIERVLDDGWRSLAPGGRMVILSYHSLEDRLVKLAFRKWAAKCICPPERPRCDCGWQPRVRLLTRRRQKPSAEEIASNPRARSAGLRAVERLVEG